MNNDNHFNSNSNNESKKALVIAVSDYNTSSGLKSIDFCKNDGQEMYNILKKNRYDIPDSHKLIGYVDSQRLKNTIYDFFTNEYNKPDDILIFYYSGHGVPDRWGKIFLAPSDIDSDHPRMTGFSFDDLTDSMLECTSLRVIAILDSCFSGSLKISKGLGLDSKSGEEAATRMANSSIEEKSDKLQQGRGRCLLAASQGYEEAYDRQEKDHSIFTYYLLEGLKGHKNAVNDEGNVTYDTLGKFIAREIGNLPAEKRPKQTPVRKGEVVGEEIVLASYPELRKIKESDYYALFGKGEEYYHRREYKEALECFDLMIKFRPKNEHALLRKGNILVELNDEKKALECFDQIIKLNKNSSDAWYYKAKLNMKIKDYGNTVKYLEQASNINPEDEKIWEAYRKVKSLMKSSKTEEQEFIISLPSTSEPSNKYSNALKQFSENISDFFNKYIISVDNKKIVEESIKQLVKKVESIQSAETIKNSEKDDLQIQIKNLIQKTLEVLPLETRISELFSILTPLNNLLDKSNNITINHLVEYEIQRKKSAQEPEIVNKRNNEDLSKYRKMNIVTSQEQEKIKNIYSGNLTKIVHSNDHEFLEDIDQSGKGKIILASSEPTVVSKEKNNCKHGKNDSPHTHGAFSFHLIEGLAGKAADPDTGIITIDNLRKYIERQMVAEQKQKPLYHIAEASNIENIKIAVSQQQFNAKISSLIRDAKDSLAIKDPKNNFVDIQNIEYAVRKINDLINLDPKNKEIPWFQQTIDDALNMYKEPAIEWLANNMTIARHKINEIMPGLYDDEIPTLFFNLSFKEFSKILNDQSKLLVLIHLSSEIKRKTKFESPDDRKLKILIAKIKASFDTFGFNQSRVH